MRSVKLALKNWWIVSRSIQRLLLAWAGPKYEKWDFTLSPSAVIRKQNTLLIFDKDNLVPYNITKCNVTSGVKSCL